MSSRCLFLGFALPSSSLLSPLRFEIDLYTAAMVVSGVLPVQILRECQSNFDDICSSRNLMARDMQARELAEYGNSI